MVGRLFQNWWWPHCARSGLHRVMKCIYCAMTVIHRVMKCTHRVITLIHCAIKHASRDNCIASREALQDKCSHVARWIAHIAWKLWSHCAITEFHLAINCSHRAITLSNGVHFVHSTLSTEVIMVTCLCVTPTAWFACDFLCHAHWFACAIHRRNCVHGLPKLLVVYWLELSIVVRVRVRARDREWISDCFFPLS